MKILIISDTHRHNENLELVLEKVKPIDLLIHLGDFECSEDYIEYLAGCPFAIIAGNNDFFSRLPKELTIKVGNYTVFLTHGHQYNVSYSMNNIVAKAKTLKADIVMFGHTHSPLITRKDNIAILNPGSLSYPRQEGRIPTYMIMEIDQNGEAHYTLNYLKG